MTPKYNAKDLSLDEQISLISGRDSWHTQGFPDKGIPSLRLSDGPNGVRGTNTVNNISSAVFVNGTGIASTFNKETWEKVGKLQAQEAYYKSADIILGPTMNTPRGPLGGRGFESFSEDPYLSGIIGANIVSGIQSKGIAATIKHFVCNDLEDDRYGSDSLVTERALREIYLEPFRLSLKYGKAKMLMASYNKINGEHASDSKKLLQNILRKEWGYDGVVSSDWYGVYTSGKSLEAGVDLEMPGKGVFRSPSILTNMLTGKEFDAGLIERAAQNILNLVEWCQTNNPNFVENGPETSDGNTPETSAALRAFAAESIVLLKNDRSLLPLSKQDDIAIIGPNAKAKVYCGGGSASLTPYHVVTPYQGICNATGKELPYELGCESSKLLPGLFEQLTHDGKPGAVGTYYLDPPGTKDRQPFKTQVFTSSNVLLNDLKDVNIPDSGVFYIEVSGTFTVQQADEYEFGLVVWGTGNLYVDNQLVIDNTTHQEKGAYFMNSSSTEVRGKAKLEAGEHSITLEWGSAATSPLLKKKGSNGGFIIGGTRVVNPETYIAQAITLAKKHHTVILFVGLNGEWESEGYDRTDYGLPLASNDLIEAVLHANPRTIIVNQSGTPVEVPWIKRAPVFMQSWYGGDELGSAIADVLFGDVNPSGKLPISWPRKIEDNPTFLNFKTEGGRVLYGKTSM